MGLCRVESKPDGKAVPVSLPTLLSARRLLADTFCGQIFVSDGKNDLYIPNTIHSPDRSLIASIDDVTILTDYYQPGLYVTSVISADKKCSSEFC